MKLPLTIPDSAVSAYIAATGGDIGKLQTAIIAGKNAAIAAIQ